TQRQHIRARAVEHEERARVWSELLGEASLDALCVFVVAVSERMTHVGARDRREHRRVHRGGVVGREASAAAHAAQLPSATGAGLTPRASFSASYRRPTTGTRPRALDPRTAGDPPRPRTRARAPPTSSQWPATRWRRPCRAPPPSAGAWCGRCPSGRAPGPPR